MNNENCTANNDCPHSCSPLQNPCWHHAEVIAELADVKNKLEQAEAQAAVMQLQYEKLSEIADQSKGYFAPQHYQALRDCIRETMRPSFFQDSASALLAEHKRYREALVEIAEHKEFVPLFAHQQRIALMEAGSRLNAQKSPAPRLRSQPMRQLIDYARDGGVYYDAREIELMCEVVAAAKLVINPCHASCSDWIRDDLFKAIAALDEYREGKENENGKHL